MTLTLRLSRHSILMELATLVTTSIRRQSVNDLSRSGGMYNRSCKFETKGQKGKRQREIQSLTSERNRLTSADDSRGIYCACNLWIVRNVVHRLSIFQFNTIVLHQLSTIKYLCTGKWAI